MEFICFTCQNCLADRKDLFDFLLNQKREAYIKEKGIKNVKLARNTISFKLDDIFDQLGLPAQYKYCCRSTLLTGITENDMLDPENATTAVPASSHLRGTL